MRSFRRKYSLSQDEGRWERQTIEPTPRGDCRAEIWGAIIAGVGAVGGGYLASQGAKNASRAQSGASDAAIAEQRRQFNTLLGLTANQRGIGNQALNTLGAVYGYKPTPMGANELALLGASPYQGKPITDGGFFNTGAGAILNPWTVTGKLGSAGKIFDPAGGLLGNLFGNKKGDEKRNINAFLSENQVFDLGNGMLGLADGTQFPERQLQHIAGTWYGATYAPDGNQEDWQRQYEEAIAPYRPQQSQAQGRTWEYMPDGSIREVMAVGPETGGNALAQTAPDYSAFFKSPDYQFRLDEGLKAVQNSAAARGSLYSGNALRGVTDYGQNLAAGEFGNWFNRQAALAGIGQAATEQAGNAAMNTGANIGNLLVGQGNARASGIIDQTNALTSTINQLGLLGGMYFGGYGGFRPNNMMATGYGVPYGGRLA